MIQLTCPSCGRRLRAKPEWVGRTAKCPGCGQPILVTTDEPQVRDEAPTEAESAEAATKEYVTVYRPPERLDRQHNYLICDKTHLVATWENNGDGWMLKTNTGFIPARRNRDKLPQQGDFRLVELIIAMTAEGKRLTGLSCYQLATRWALTVLDQGDDLVLEKVTGPAGLNRDQKNVVRQALRDQFMRPVWQDAAAVLEYLSNADGHSSRVGSETSRAPDES